MSDKLPSPSERFKKNLMILSEIINDMFEEGQENGVVPSGFNVFAILKLILSKTSGEYMIKRFIKRTNKHWEQIKEKDLNYFKNIGLELFQTIETKGVEGFKDEEEISSTNLIGKLSSGNFKDFKTILEGSYEYEGDTIDIFDDTRKEDIWKIMHSFVKISLCYIHETRKPMEGKYTVEFFPEIQIKQAAEEWNVRSIHL